jgi:hypothetical protein
MEPFSAHDIEEHIRRAELRLEQFLIARDLAAANSAALAADVQVNATLAMLAYLRSLQRPHQPPNNAAQGDAFATIAPTR